ncbi:unnamed protein product [Diatraea saccharalis]|uniref:Peptidase S1 domain-containing protein n=1 Tax=Diatraea saccharalis TaxID=40085 RepID=A0A9N9W953_9NEOP|nr:unnamed protein product [Diatraea saccharalis]
MHLDKCDNCIATEDCQTYKELNRYEQSKWRERFNCPESNEKDIPLGFSSTAKGDLVCCPANVWGVENPSHEDHSYTNTDANIPRPNSDSDLNRRDGFNYQPNRNYNNRPINTGNNNWGNRGGIRDDYDEFGRPYWQRRAKQNYVENPYFLPANGNNGGSKNFKEPSNPQQCPVTSFPPDPASGCCGLEASNNDGINSQLNAQYDPNANRRNNWMPQMNYQSSESWPSWMSRSNYGRRRGKETDLEQFPWTVLLKTTFVYPTKEAAFACGGSLISSRYVLTAGHCVFDAQGKIKG